MSEQEEDTALVDDRFAVEPPKQQIVCCGQCWYRSDKTEICEVKAKKMYANQQACWAGRPKTNEAGLGKR